MIAILWIACKQKEKPPLLIAAASSVQFVLEEVINEFERRHSVKCELITSSSGKLYAQIKAGASFDIFISADQEYPNLLYKEGMSEGPPILFAEGRLIAWSTQHVIDSTTFLLSDSKFKKIAIANPEIAPYGNAALAFIKKEYEYEKLADRLVYGENISQVNQFVNVGAADVGLTGQAVVHRPGISARGSWILIPETSHPAILQDFLLLNNGKSSKEAQQAFVDFLKSDEGKFILRKYGYE